MDLPTDLHADLPADRPAAVPADLPAGLTARPLTMADAAGVYAVMAADQLDQLGRVDLEVADIVADWQRPSFDLADTIGIFERDRLVAYAEYSGQGRGDAAVAPTYRGRGLGTALARWMQETARARDAVVVGMPVPQGGPADRTLTALGYRARWTSWVLELPADVPLPQRPLPTGYSVRAAAATELATLHDVLEDAFAEWSARPRESLADFRAKTVARPGFAPWLLRVVADPVGVVVAGAVVSLSGEGEIFVERLATRADQRHRGLAVALLADCFQAGRDHGGHTGALTTDSRTGALDLYRKIGMVVVSTWVNRAIDL